MDVFCVFAAFFYMITVFILLMGDDPEKEAAKAEKKRLKAQEKFDKKQLKKERDFQKKRLENELKDKEKAEERMKNAKSQTSQSVKSEPEESPKVEAPEKQTASEEKTGASKVKNDGQKIEVVVKQEEKEKLPWYKDPDWVRAIVAIATLIITVLTLYFTMLD